MAQNKVVMAKIKVRSTHFWHTMEAIIFFFFYEGTTRLKSASSSTRKNARGDTKWSFPSVSLSHFSGFNFPLS